MCVTWLGLQPLSMHTEAIVCRCEHLTKLSLDYYDFWNHFNWVIESLLIIAEPNKTRRPSAMTLSNSRVVTQPNTVNKTALMNHDMIWPFVSGTGLAIIRRLPSAVDNMTVKLQSRQSLHCSAKVCIHDQLVMAALCIGQAIIFFAVRLYLRN